MWVKLLKESKMHCKVLLVSSCLLLLVASWLGAWPIKPAKETLPPESQKVSVEQMLTLPQEKSTESSEIMQNQSPNPSKLSTESYTTSGTLTITMDQYVMLLKEVEKIKEAQAAAEEIEVIEDALAADTKKEADAIIEEYNQLAGENARQAEEIVKLAQEARSKFYLKIGGVIGFEESMMPTWGLSLTAGTKIGKNLLLEAGVEYDIGTFIKPLNGIADPTIDRLRITGSVGWLF